MRAKLSGRRLRGQPCLSHSRDIRLKKLAEDFTNDLKRRESQQSWPDENSFKKFHFSCTGVLEHSRSIGFTFHRSKPLPGSPMAPCLSLPTIARRLCRPTEEYGSRAVRRPGRAGWPPPPELVDPATGTWTTNGALTTPRRNHTATLLTNG